LLSMPPSLGKAIREFRLKADVGLREFAQEIGISAAHQSDIEHGRRMPSDDVLRATGKRLAKVGGTYEVLKQLDARLKDDVREWVSQTPGVEALLRTAKDSGLSVDEVLQRMKQALKEDGGRDKAQ
jgi:transcriptional regulator with XRE-family HTH domain